MQSASVAIIGAGHAGAHAAIALRAGGFAGSIAMITQEQQPPYERPPLSKEYLAGEKPFDRLLIRPRQFWAEKNVELMTGCRVRGLDARARRVEFDGGGELAYEQAIWATGGAPRSLTCAGRELAGVHSVRTRGDVDRMRSELEAASQIVVIGGGYIGLEAAAVLTKLGKRVVLVEALDRVLARVAGPQLSHFFEAEHRRHKVDLRVSSTVNCLTGDNGKVSAVELCSGDVVPADMVIVGIGITPAVAPLLEAGAEGGNGVLVDEYCRTTLPGVYAIGDCALHRNAFAADTFVRIESVQNAVDQAGVAAKAILGSATPFRAVPWFWSKQYDLMLQTVGLSLKYDDTVVRGDPASRAFSVVYLREGRVIALDCVNAMRDYVQGRKLVLNQASVPRALLGDSCVALKDM